MKSIYLKLVLPTIVVLSFITLQACNQSREKQEPTEQHNPAQMEQHEDEHVHDGNVPGMLTLNNGSKWLADDPTNKNAATLISIGEQFSKRSKKTLTDYQAFGNDIQSAINKMIKECTMKGEADQALHFWFLPILEQVNTLKEATDTTGLSSITSEMNHRLNEYHDYFQ